MNAVWYMNIFGFYEGVVYSVHQKFSVPAMVFVSDDSIFNNL